jgi:hypothetical protein
MFGVLLCQSKKELRGYSNVLVPMMLKETLLMIGVRARAVAAGTLILLFTVGFVLLVHVLASNAFGKPRVRLPAGRTYDFGEVEEGEMVRHTFPIENIGSKVLRILKVSTGCGCTGAKMDTMALNPGKKAEIEVSYNGRRVRDRESLIALVQTNDKANPYVEFTLTGFVRYKVFWYPSSVSFFGEQGQALAPKQIIFTPPRRSNDAFELEVASVSSSRILAQLLKDERGVVLNVAVSPNCPCGAYSEQVIVRHAKDKSIKPISIPVYVKILSSQPS